MKCLGCEELSNSMRACRRHPEEGSLTNCSVCSFEELNPPNLPLTLTEASYAQKNLELPKSRKDNPVFSGVLAYFPDAIIAVSQHSKKGNDKHNQGLPLHWDKTKSNDHADALGRHFLDIGPNWDQLDPETGSYHATALAWRALALLQTLLEKEKK